MKMLHHIRQNRFATHRKHSAEKFYPKLLIRQTWLLLITSCLYRWGTHLLSSAIVRTKTWKNGSMVRSKRGRVLPTWYSRTARKMEQMCSKRWSILWINHISEFNVFFRKKFRVSHLWRKTFQTRTVAVEPMTKTRRLLSTTNKFAATHFTHLTR